MQHNSERSTVLKHPAIRAVPVMLALFSFPALAQSTFPKACSDNSNEVCGDFSPALVSLCQEQSEDSDSACTSGRWGKTFYQDLNDELESRFPVKECSQDGGSVCGEFSDELRSLCHQSVTLDDGACGTNQWDKNFYKDLFTARETLRGRLAAGGGSASSAFLSVIGYAEGTNDEYNIIFTFARFSSYNDHPRQKKCAGSLCSDAAGRYQFLSSTWDGVKRPAKATDFAPVSQDKGAIYLLKTKGVSDLNTPLDRNAFSRNIYKLASTWASFPTASGSGYYPGQGARKIGDLWAKYQDRMK